MAKFAGLRDPVALHFENSSIAYRVDAFNHDRCIVHRRRIVHLRILCPTFRFNPQLLSGH
jgi:hypothetical protein